MTTRLNRGESREGDRPSLRGGIRLRTTGMALGAVLLFCPTLSGCATQGLAFRTDDRVDIVAPDRGDLVELPLTLEWTARDVDGSFAVFVDQAPMPPGKPLSWVARGDDDCDESAGCPDAQYLAERGVLATSEHSVVIERVPFDTGNRRCAEYDATVVLLDDEGRRRGESAWTVPFRVCRPR